MLKLTKSGLLYFSTFANKELENSEANLTKFKGMNLTCDFKIIVVNFKIGKYV